MYRMGVGLTVQNIIYKYSWSTPKIILFYFFELNQLIVLLLQNNSAIDVLYIYYIIYLLYLFTPEGKSVQIIQLYS